jgi:hypothetical protein
LQAVGLQTVAEAQVTPPGQGEDVPDVQVPALLQVPSDIRLAFPCESTVHDAVPQLAPVSTAQAPVVVEHV